MEPTRRVIHYPSVIALCSLSGFHMIRGLILNDHLLFNRCRWACITWAAGQLTLFLLPLRQTLKSGKKQVLQSGSNRTQGSKPLETFPEPRKSIGKANFSHPINQCDQIMWFLKVLDSKFSYKSSQNTRWDLGFLKNILRRSSVAPSCEPLSQAFDSLQK